MGIMDEIRSLLAQDKSIAEIIALGFKSSTVYKARLRLRRQAPLAQTLNRIAEVETEADETQALREQVAALAPKDRSADEWNREYHKLVYVS